MRTTSMSIVSAAAVVASLGACSTQTPPEDAKAPATTYRMERVYTVSLPRPPEAEPATLKLQLDAPLDKCYREDPHFGFDETQPKPKDYLDLAIVAGCLNSKPYRSSSVLLVGHADDRGPARYNQELGLERARKIKEILTGYGVGADRIRVVSEGEVDAKGERDDYSYGYDRRVDVIQLMARAPR